MALWYTERAVTPQFEPIDLLSLDCETSGLRRPEAVFDWIQKPTTNPKSKVIELDAFPAFPAADTYPDVCEVADYLNLLLQSYCDQPGSILLPSLMCLSEFFGVTYPVIQKAFKTLKQYGHDYMIPGMYGDISVWTARESVQSKKPIAL